MHAAVVYVGGVEANALVSRPHDRHPLEHGPQREILDAALGEAERLPHDGQLLVGAERHTCAVVIGPGADYRAVRLVAPEHQDWHLHDGDEVEPSGIERKVLYRKPHPSGVGLHQALRVEDETRPRGPGSDVALHSYAAALEPEAIPGVSEVLGALTLDGGVTAAVAPDRDVAEERADLVTRLGAEGRAIDAVVHVVDEVHVARVVDEGPTGVVGGDAAANAGGRLVHDPRTVEVDGVPTAHVDLQPSIDAHRRRTGIDEPVLEGFRLVGAAESVEPGIRDLDVGRMHEHHVPPALDLI